MRVHLVTDRYAVGGGLEHIVQIVRGLPGISFGVFGQPGPGAARFKQLANARVHETGYGPGQVMKGDPQVVHVHHTRALFALFKNPLVKHRVPVVFTAHGLHLHKYEFMPGPTAKIKYFLRFHLEKVLLKRVDRVIAVSREDYDFLVNRYRLANVIYLTNGIDFKRLDALKGRGEELRPALGLPPGYRLLTTVARFDFQKGYDILVKAISLLKDWLFKQEKTRGIRFVLVGGGQERQKMETLARRLGVMDFLLFLGERADVYEILRASDLLVLPSRWEGLPIVLLEAGRLKVPVLASNTYGNREMIGTDRGILFENLDAADLAYRIRAVIDGNDNLDRLADNLYREVQNVYNLPAMLSGLEHLYGSLCNP